MQTPCNKGVSWDRGLFRWLLSDNLEMLKLEKGECNRSDMNFWECKSWLVAWGDSHATCWWCFISSCLAHNLCICWTGLHGGLDVVVNWLLPGFVGENFAHPPSLGCLPTQGISYMCGMPVSGPSPWSSQPVLKLLPQVWPNWTEYVMWLNGASPKLANRQALEWYRVSTRYTLGIS